MVISGRTKHHHQAPVYPVIADKTPLRVNLAGIFARHHATIEHRPRRQQRQSPFTDIGFILWGYG